MNYRILQLADSAFPTGGFAHSGGLEAALQLGEISGAGLEDALHTMLWQAGYGALPLVGAAFDEPERLPEFDAACDVFLSNHVSNRASRSQGSAFLSATEKTFQLTELSFLREALRRDKLKQHYAPVFGSVTKMLDLTRGESQRLFLFLALRGALSAAVRLGIVGPYQGQQIQSGCGEILERVFARCHRLEVDDLAQPAPLPDLFHSMHDRLYSRLFQS